MAEFWRRWNMTLSRFLKEYLYIPLGGNRKGSVKRYINLLVTMLLGGLWHGANWTFVIWGVLHGVYLCVNHGWIALKKYFSIPNSDGFIATCISRIVTILCVVIAWVFFRSPDFNSAFHILHAMFFNVTMDHAFSWYQRSVTQYFSLLKIYILFMITFIICWGFPNAYQWLSRCSAAFITKDEINYQGILVWSPSIVWSIFVSLLLVIGICFIQSSSTFLYFQF